jgi:uncharacterized protein YjbI with pentapeptide repeats
MANQQHRAILKQGVESWNRWRHEDLGTDWPNLEVADLSGAQLSGIDFNKANLRGAHLTNSDLTSSDLRFADLESAHLEGACLERATLQCANLRKADLSGARLAESHLVPMLPGQVTDLTEAILTGAHLNGAFLQGVTFDGANLTDAYMGGAHLRTASLKGAILTNAVLVGAEFQHAILVGADLTGANLSEAIFIATDFTNATLTGCRVYGVSVWDVQLTGAKQAGLVISPEGTAKITVDDLEVAQFLNLLRTNRKIRNVIHSVTSKAVLILGRFSVRQKPVLDALHAALRDNHNLVPILFDWEPSENRDLSETVLLLANMSRFVIADITDAKSIPQELSVIVPNIPSVPVQPIILASEYEYGMFEHWRQFGSVLPEYRYESQQQLLAALDTGVLAPIKHWEEATDKAAAKERQMREQIEVQRRRNSQAQSATCRSARPEVDGHPALPNVSIEYLVSATTWRTTSAASNLKDSLAHAHSFDFSHLGPD